MYSIIYTHMHVGFKFKSVPMAIPCNTNFYLQFTADNCIIHKSNALRDLYSLGELKICLHGALAINYSNIIVLLPLKFQYFHWVLVYIFIFPTKSSTFHRIIIWMLKFWLPANAIVHAPDICLFLLLYWAPMWSSHVKTTVDSYGWFFFHAVGIVILINQTKDH